MKPNSLPLLTLENKRDAYGFVVRPQHLQTYREYANIYKEEEEERSNRWKEFLESQGASDNVPAAEGSEIVSPVAEATSLGDDRGYIGLRKGFGPEESDVQVEQELIHKTQCWSQIRPSLALIEQWMSARVKRKTYFLIDEGDAQRSANGIVHNQEIKILDDSEDEFYDVERSDVNQEASSGYGSGTDAAVNLTNQGALPESSVPWKEELEFLVSGGLPMALRGEIWQAFTGIGKRRVEGYYQNLLALETRTVESNEVDFSSNDASDVPKKSNVSQSEKWKRQIEKDLPRTFPGHPALDEDGRNTLRQLLTAYARHNPSVGYCQAMNFFAGLLLLLMPEENAFWTLTAIIDDYFDGYYSEEMIEAQVDQLVLEELVRERFPKLLNHLDYLGLEVAWIAGPWFLSIFVNMLPWESVLRIWDVLLFEGNRVMLFRTALALMELYGPALVTTKDAGDAVNLLQSLAGSTFDSSQLVLTACMGYQVINETRLLELRKKHRPTVMAFMDERSKGLHTWRDSHGLASKFYGFKCDIRFEKANSTEVVNGSDEGNDDQQMESVDEFIGSLTVNYELDSESDLKKQVTWLKAELCRLLEDRRSAIMRADELEIALMEMVKQDNRRLLSARVEQLEQEVSELRQALSDKQEQEQAMLQVLIRVEQEQKVTEDARMFAEQDAAAQKYASHMLQIHAGKV
ncbi:rab GTPase-activating protein 1 isoform X2 [Phalaenopsis equestris]|uniref:rab GTPase-activating protein 1 isoform X2 n=1 Tax=Phalaenopsis equestris TaxID=78828 RepID=UPI0009E3A733|nr:rab GTPase-activating protein 1 isoform X2 [Phalaenopsis equestris]